MFLNPVEYGRKAEEVLWRKVFYQIIQMLKHNKKLKQVRHHGSLETAYRTHLAAAMGFYQHLLFRLQQEFRLSLVGVLDFHMVPDTRSPGGNNSRKMWTSAAQEWAQRACHRCLICLGDIARYQRDIDPAVSAATAQRFYHQAFMLFPEIGMPHNQLGTLSGSRYFSCEAAYHYFRCLACEKPFDGAQGNLKRLFEKNQTRLKHKNHAARDLPPDMQRPQDIQRFFVGYLQLIEIFSGPEDRVTVPELQAMCQQTLQDFNLCMFYEPGSAADCDEDEPESSSSSELPQFLDDDVIFKIVASLICSIHLLQNIGSAHVTVATAFLLALFSHTLNHVIIRLQGALYDRQNPNKLLESGLGTEDVQDDASSDCLDEQSPSPMLKAKDTEDTSERHGSNSSGPAVGEGGKDDAKQHPKRYRSSRLRNLRRRRRRHQSESSSDLSEMSEDSDLSEGGDDGEEDENLSEDSEDDQFNYFDNDSDSDLSDSMMDNQDSPPNAVQTTRSTNDQSNSKTAVNGEVGERLANGDKKPAGSVSATNSRSRHSKGGSGDWSNLAERRYLANMSSELFSSSGLFLGQNLTMDLGVHSNGNCNDVMQGKTHVPVPPGFVSSEEARHVADITEKLANFVIETDTETLVRVCSLRHFGYFLSDIEGFDFTYSADQAVFIGPTPAETLAEGNEKLAQERMRDADTRRNQLMRDMAQLRLQAEVSQLEGCLESAQQPHFPPYAVVDATSLCSNLPLVRELAQSARCIIIIPLAVIDQLDVQKKESSGAREAIRWLEAEFRRGNRYIRAQKSNETVSANNQRIFKKRHRDLW
nr:hypothetical protein BaRGS_006097 [Batillaria attramentaria]